MSDVDDAVSSSSDQDVDDLEDAGASGIATKCPPNAGVGVGVGMGGGRAPRRPSNGLPPGLHGVAGLGPMTRAT